MTFKCGFLFALFACCMLRAQQPAEIARTPPMGWNSWDSFGTTVTEADVRAAALVMHQRLQAFGWQFVTVDMEWSTINPTAEGNGKAQEYTLDAFGRYTPALNRFPSAADGKGFAPLAGYVHSLGLKFGIHILQGIPREAVARNSPIEGSPFEAVDAANSAGLCGWNPDNFDMRAGPAAQAYYDSIARLYASWGVDLIKVDCITQPRYKSAELQMLHAALKKVDRPIALSLSPGEPPIEYGGEFAANADQWRISNDVWDIWKGDSAYPQGVGDQFARTAYWLRTQTPGHWPDADMLSLGALAPAPGWGTARECRLTHDEQRTMVTLWSMFRSPLIFGGNLTRLDEWTASLLTNPEVIRVDQHSRRNHPVLTTPQLTVWTAEPEDGTGTYVAAFNTGTERSAVVLRWADLGLSPAPHQVRELWSRKDLPGAKASFEVSLDGHASTLLLVK